MDTLSTVGETRDKIQLSVRSAIASQTHLASEELKWGMRTDAAFHYNVQAVLLALDEMCADCGLDFDPAQIPQQSVFRTFPRLANFCAYLEYRLGLRA